MTSTHDQKSVLAACRWCAHALNEHELWLVVHNAPAGIVTCPVANCTCLATWGATASRSTATQRVHIRDQVAAALRAGGLPELAARVSGLAS